MSDEDRKHRTAFLVGRLNGYKRGNLSASHLIGAIRAAEDHGVPNARIHDLLREHGVRWNRETGSIERDK
jgi:hypothetical protein